jgi:hypothetical protein
MLAVLDHLSDICDAGGAQQLPQLDQFVGVVVGERRDQVGALAGATLWPLPVD